MILAAPTPAQWVQAAAQRWRELLVDHAACEKKAASTAIALLFAYPEDRELSLSLARLAREELRHFEQVSRLMERCGVTGGRQKPGRYASQLRAQLTTHEPQRKVDLLLTSALIEARSCERFELLAPLLPEPVSGFYADLARAERRHHELYTELALRAAHAAGQDAATMHRRLAELALIEANLATSPDEHFRFHSGLPAAA
ncbi:MAG: tRNA isopentenyl-2-thiomethyl-A-37 hydroxylase MiaE [Steroidobacteraceae bacterium]